jgi:hypothetical protein
MAFCSLAYSAVEVVCDEAHADDACCQPSVVSPIIHERAWTSPIWYTPAR